MTLLICSTIGIPGNRYTLSTRGYPCHYDLSDTSCAWCALGSQQCGKVGTWANDYKYRNYYHPYKKESTCLPVLNSERYPGDERKKIMCVGQGIY